MTPRTIDRFFQTLAEEFSRPATIIVTGAAAGALWGHIRPSQDVDFAVQLVGSRPPQWEQFQAAVDRTVERTGLQVNYAEDIDRWGSITLLDYRRHTVPHRRFGTLNVRLLDPVYWSIGKLARYFDVDVHDVVSVLKRTRVPPTSVIRVWGQALRASPRSTAVIQFRNQVEHFLRTYGRVIWGRQFDPDTALRQFHRAVGLRRPPRSSKAS